MSTQGFASDRVLLGMACLLVAAGLLWVVLDDSTSAPQPVSVSSTQTATTTATLLATPVFTALASAVPTPVPFPTEQPTATSDIPVLTPSDGFANQTPIETPPDFNPAESTITEVPTLPLDTATPEIINTPEPTYTPEPTFTPEPTATATPVPRPITILTGTVRWSGEVVVTKDTLVSAGAVLLVEPGTTVRFDTGISLYVEGTLQAVGRSDAPITMTATRAPWGGIFIRPRGTALLDTTLISRAGAMATTLYAEAASLTMRNTTLNNNTGQMIIKNGVTTMQQSVLRDNTLPYGAMVDVSVTDGATLVVENSRIGPNTQAEGGSAVAVAIPNAGSTMRMTLSGSIFTSSSGTNVLVNSAVPIDGAIQCNTFAMGAIGMQIRSTLPQVPGIGVALRNNVFEGHTAKFNGARGVTSDVAVDATSNWWNSSTGPYDPKRYAAGKGEPVGSNVVADSWLTARPACAPLP